MSVLKFLFNAMLMVFSIVIPKSKKYVIIGGWQGKRFADNSRGMFEYLDIHKKELGIKKVFWYTRNKSIYEALEKQGKDVLYGYRLRSIYWHLRSKVHMIDQNTRDILGILSVRCIRINLWHGIPLKKIGNYMSGSCTTKWYSKYTSSGCWPEQYILATSEYTGHMLAYAMGVKEEKCLIASYPRNARLYQCRMEKKREEENFIIFYLPTFRDKNEKNPLLQMDLSVFNEKLIDKNMLLYIKPHFASMSSWDTAKVYTNIIILEAVDDVYDWLYKTDLLVTDYSSVFFDFMITRRAILFYPYDIAYYEDSERGFAMPYEENTPGDKVYSLEEFEKKVFYIKEHYTEYIEKYEKQYNKINLKMNKYLHKPNYDDIIKFWIN